jgi:hypothetical protein
MLWTNGINSSEMTGFTASLSQSATNFDKILITYNDYGTSNSYRSAFMTPAQLKSGVTLVGNDGYSYPVPETHNPSRLATLTSDTVVTFTNGYYSNVGHGSNEASCVPIQIFGIKLQ